jgi:hypothetical protein
MHVHRCQCGSPVYVEESVCLRCGASLSREPVEPATVRPQPAHDGQGASYADEQHPDASRRA